LGEFKFKLIEALFILFVIAFISCRPAGISHSRLNAKFGQDIELQKEIATDQYQKNNCCFHQTSFYLITLSEQTNLAIL
jgi:hypothetical protein